MEKEWVDVEEEDMEGRKEWGTDDWWRDEGKWGLRIIEVVRQCDRVYHLLVLIGYRI
jgi:hypothetical protein